MLEVEDLHVSYDGNIAVDGFSFLAKSSTVTTIIGSNGAGKTTLLKCISGLLPARSGRVRLNGEDILRLPTAQIVRLGICMVPEGRLLFPRMSVLDNLLVGSHLRNDKAGIAKDLERIYHYFPVLKKKAGAFARNLSGGEQQMVAFGRALMASPKVLLLDEPSIGLAPLVERQLMKTVGQLAIDAGITVVLVEQNASLALSVSNYGYVLELGSNVFEGSVDALLSSPRVREAYLGF
ncbi:MULTISPECIES: ABC transporter ATP-binding protein [unclassified Rhizobium]|uniref:ABC transporter ATP-binding protein n=1 Tax=unclassified Rhizobium TaxID=2613769 RepID=UPI000BDC6256|nr:MULTISPECIES: ABC transporter ATP-binding protein [unclassified Rhizobium]MDH7810054.1 branched-chain amino acid transport system ATP-binding protein [Rhizobium sp. AN67]MDQ4408662.1 ABC transporter ATP-binding protein [Rhizobium sp. AN63]SOD50218.1 amino acid/amide ABC transporter ATP-binding protein 2, HAAT family (TC 3.A.1.4.-) [Rhizobium sp. AN6A]